MTFSFSLSLNLLFLKEKMFAFFNSRTTRLITSGEAGFQVYDVPPAAPSFRRVRNESSFGPISFLAMEEKSQRAALVQSNHGTHMKNRVLILFDMTKNEVLSEMHFESPIVGVRYNMARLMVIQERRLQVFDPVSLKPFPQITTLPNPRGLGALSNVVSSEQPCYIAWPHTNDTQTTGDAIIFECQTNKLMLVAQAHQNPLVALEFSATGTKLATCSTKGTIIRVYSIPDCQLLHTLRRGTKEADVHLLTFSPNADIVLVGSSSGTLHLFRCSDSDAGTLIADKKGAGSYAKVTCKENSKFMCGLSADGATLLVLTLPTAGGNVGPGSVTQGPSSIIQAEVLLEQFTVGRDKVVKVQDFKLR